MLTAVAFLPGAPLIVPEISGPGASADVGPLRDAVLEVGRRLAEVSRSWIVVGVAAGADDRVAIPRTGTFAGFGVDVRVSLDPVLGPADDAATQVAPVDEMATPLLVAAWLRGQVAADTTIDAVVIDPSTSPADCVALGDRLARGCAHDDRVGVLVVGDGSTGLTARAPSGLIEGAADVQMIVDEALAAGETTTLANLDVTACAAAHIDGRAAWQVASALWSAASAAAPRSESLYRDAPFGVGYQVVWWGHRP